jgi:alkanesulfonate monooxygenase SsuD/methylene tetrahydromethanopterin reductase-like flavin-dependent oxidoreductase (luciferase family)
MPYRHPAVLANMAATVDIISGGRLELGLGAGWNQEESDAYGIELHSTLTDRFDAFDEGCEAIIGLLTNVTTTFKGRFVQLTEARCEPKPVQQPHPPICIGGAGERRTLRSVARFAQHWNFPAGDTDFYLQKLDVLRGHCDDVGRDVREITTSTHLRLPENQEIGPLLDQAEQFAAAGLDLGVVALSPPHTPAVLEPIAAALDHLKD